MKKISKNLSRCYAPDLIKKNNPCVKKIINAHSISKSSNLGKIAVDEHVIGIWKPDDFHALEKKSFSYNLSKIGWKKASTERMFCETHDREIFKPLENGNEFTLSEEQLFLLSYRSYCYELFNINNLKYGNDIYIISRDKIEEYSFEFNINDYFVEGCNGKISQALNKGDFLKASSGNEIKIYVRTKLSYLDISTIKKEMDNLLINRGFNNLSHYIIELNGKANILCSFVLNPIKLFSNKIIQSNESGEVLGSLSINMVIRDNKSYVIFSWLNKFDEIFRDEFKYINNVEPRKIESILVEFLFKNSQNIYISPDYWVKINVFDQDLLIRWVQPNQQDTNLCYWWNGKMLGNIKDKYFL